MADEDHQYTLVAVTPLPLLDVQMKLRDWLLPKRVARVVTVALSARPPYRTCTSSDSVFESLGSSSRLNLEFSARCYHSWQQWVRRSSSGPS